VVPGPAQRPGMPLAHQPGAHDGRGQHGWPERRHLTASWP
jgi:hypothetical protein